MSIYIFIFLHIYLFIVPSINLLCIFCISFYLKCPSLFFFFIFNSFYLSLYLLISQSLYLSITFLSSSSIIFEIIYDYLSLSFIIYLCQLPDGPRRAGQGNDDRRSLPHRLHVLREEGQQGRRRLRHGHIRFEILSVSQPISSLSLFLVFYLSLSLNLSILLSISCLLYPTDATVKFITQGSEKRILIGYPFIFIISFFWRDNADNMVGISVLISAT